MGQCDHAFGADLSMATNRTYVASSVGPENTMVPQCDIDTLSDFWPSLPIPHLTLDQLSLMGDYDALVFDEWNAEPVQFDTTCLGDRERELMEFNPFFRSCRER
jgi:hypothetical protein